MTTQANAITSHVQAMMVQGNREVGARVPQHANIMASRMRDITRMKQPMFFGPRINEDLQNFLDEIYKILYIIGVT